MKCWKCNAELGSADTDGLCAACRAPAVTVYCTDLGLRYVRRKMEGGPWTADDKLVLQQLWHNIAADTYEWRDVPIMEGE